MCNNVTLSLHHKISMCNNVTLSLHHKISMCNNVTLSLHHKISMCNNVTLSLHHKTNPGQTYYHSYVLLEMDLHLSPGILFPPPIKQTAMI